MCEDDSYTCEKCGGKGEQCCSKGGNGSGGSERCNEVFLTCVEGTCECGGKG